MAFGFRELGIEHVFTFDQHDGPALEFFARIVGCLEGSTPERIADALRGARVDKGDNNRVSLEWITMLPVRSWANAFSKIEFNSGSEGTVAGAVVDVDAGSLELFVLADDNSDPDDSSLPTALRVRRALVLPWAQLRAFSERVSAEVEARDARDGEPTEFHEPWAEGLCALDVELM